MPNDSLGSGIDALTPTVEVPAEAAPDSLEQLRADFEAFKVSMAVPVTQPVTEYLHALAYDYDAFKAAVVAKAPGAWNLA